MPHDNLNRRVQCLSTAICLVTSLPASHARAQSVHDAESILRQLTQSLTLPRRGEQSDAIGDAERQIDAALAQFRGTSTTLECYESAIAYIAAENPDSPGVFAESAGFYITGSRHTGYFMFAQGTMLQAAVAQINAAGGSLGAHAAIATENPNRIVVRSTPGEWIFCNYLEIEQLSGANPIVFASAVGGHAISHWIDYGCFVGEPTCAQPATVYLSSVGTNGDGPTTIIVGGFRGTQIFSFSSGTSVGNIAAAIDTMAHFTGVSARWLQTPPYRVEVRSTFLGSDGFVSVMQVGGPPPIIFGESIGGTPSYSRIENGSDRMNGDANCDRIVNVVDLVLVVQNWGQCPLPPFVCEADLTNDSAVNVNDLLTVINNWGAAH